MAGQVCWFEIPVTDPSRAATFYADVLGWETTPDGEGVTAPMPGVSRVHTFKKGVLNGAFLVVPEVATVGTKMTPLSTFYVDSIEDTVSKVEKHGGRLHL